MNKITDMECHRDQDSENLLPQGMATLDQDTPASGHHGLMVSVDVLLGHRDSMVLESNQMVSARARMVPMSQGMEGLLQTPLVLRSVITGAIKAVIVA